jgi:hypothetical protein
LEEQHASEAAYKKYYESRPVDSEAFRLRGEGEITGNAIPLLEFDVKKVLLKRASNSRTEIPKASQQLYFGLGSGLRTSPEYRAAWQSHLGKEVILLSRGEPNPRGNPTYIPYPYPVHTLATGNHWLDQLPIPLDRLPEVVNAAERFGFVRAD